MIEKDNIILEEINKSDINDELKKFLNSYDLKNKVETLTKSLFKNDKDLEKKMLEVSSNVLVQLFKTFWVKKSFWQGQLSNKPN